MYDFATAPLLRVSLYIWGKFDFLFYQCIVPTFLSILIISCPLRGGRLCHVWLCNCSTPPSFLIYEENLIFFSISVAQTFLPILIISCLSGEAVSDMCAEAAPMRVASSAGSRGPSRQASVASVSLSRPTSAASGPTSRPASAKVRYRQTPIFQQPFIRKQRFSLKYSLVSPPQRFLEVCLNSEYMWKWSPVYNFNNARALKKLLSAGVEVTSTLPNSDTLKDVHVNAFIQLCLTSTLFC
jgi:hypothetical protein